MNHAALKAARAAAIAAATVALLFSAAPARAREKGPSLNSTAPGATADEKLAAKPGLRVQVVDDKGQPVERAQFTLWKAVDPSEPLKGPAPSPWMIQRWQDPKSGVTWQPQSHWEASAYTIDGLKAGDYLVTAEKVDAPHNHGQGTPYGVSKPAHFNGKRLAKVTVKLEGNAPLTARITDAVTREPVSANIMLTRDDGLPIGFGSQGWSAWTDDKGLIRYGALVPGQYVLRARATAWRYGGKDYAEVERRIAVGSGEVAVAIPLAAVVPDRTETELRWPFVIEGVATDTDGRPMPGVEIRVAAGWGTLMEEGSTQTGEDGKYYFRFGPGIHSVDDLGNPRAGKVSPQAAVVFASKKGFYETNLCRQGNLMITSDEAEAEPNNWSATVLLPNKPYKLDFTMAPAATVKGRLTDAAGQPLAGKDAWATGTELYPATSAIGYRTTDADGRFIWPEAPLKSFQFVMRAGKGEVRTAEELKLTKPGEYEVLLVYDAWAGTLSLSTTREP